ncbi:hypothetical protein [Oleomonas cavernae]|uniref:hypothetical protein n=1 Tax=Oleomonas cavernae TaxID=2320859 RepID=UPI0018F4F29C|nr:hypothetical protein [Oleomonas cavernae]
MTLTTTASGAPDADLRRRLEGRRRLFTIGSWLAFLVLLVLSYEGAGIDLGKLWTNRDNIAVMAGTSGPRISCVSSSAPSGCSISRACGKPSRSRSGVPSLPWCPPCPWA